MKKILFISIALFIKNGRAQELLSRPHLAQYGSPWNSGLLGSDISGTNKFYGGSFYLQAKNITTKNLQGYLNYSFYRNFDTLSLKTDHWYTRNYEIGIGEHSMFRNVHTGYYFNIGSDYFKYRTYDTNQVARSLELYKLIFGFQYNIGYLSDDLEFGLSIKAFGYYNWNKKSSVMDIAENKLDNLSRFNYARSNMIIEPELYLVLRNKSDGALKMAARAPMVRNNFEQFPIPKSIYYSLGFFYSL